MGQRLVLSVYENRQAKKPIGALYYHWSAYTMSAYDEAMRLLLLFSGMVPITKGDFVKLNGENLKITAEIRQETFNEEQVENSLSDYTQMFFDEAAGPEAEFYANTIEDKALRLIRCAELLGGGVDCDDIDYVKKKYPGIIFKEDYISRNNGLVAISPKGIKELKKWSEGDVNIYLDDETIGGGPGIVSNIFTIIDEARYEEWYQDDENSKDFDNWKNELPTEPFNLEETFSFPQLVELVGHFAQPEHYHNSIFIGKDGRVYQMVA